MPIIRHGYSVRPNRDSQWRARARNIIRTNATFCHLCGQPFVNGDHIEADHIIPIAKGGNDSITNLRPTHRYCNRANS